MADYIDINLEILQSLEKENYRYAVCSLMNESLKAGTKATTILLTPIKEMIAGFGILKSIRKESYLTDIKEIESDFQDSSQEAEGFRYVIKKEVLDTV